MAKAKKIKIEALPDGSHREAGTFDNASRWYPAEDFQVPGSFEVRSPSRAWPYSYLKHFYTRRYAQRLAEHNPRLYLATAGIAKNSESGKAIIAHFAA